MRRPVPSAFAIGAFAAAIVVSALLLIVEVVSSLEPVEDELDPED